jgi:hypothetical protein
LAELNLVIDIYENSIGHIAGRTRQMIDNHGPIQALSRLVQSPDLQKGFRVLRDRGELQHTFEAVIVRFPQLFARGVVEAAQWRLDNASKLL